MTPKLRNVSRIRDAEPTQEQYAHSGFKLERRRQRNSHRWRSVSDTSACPTECHDSTIPQQSVQARTKEWRTGWRRTLWHVFLPFFQQVQHLRSDAPTTSPRDLTLKMAAHQTSSSDKGKTSQRRLVFGFMVKCRDHRSAGRLGKGHVLYCRHL